jgi:hypothetical protein
LPFRARIGLCLAFAIAILSALPAAQTMAGQAPPQSAPPKLTLAFARTATKQALTQLHPRVQLPLGPSGRIYNKPNDAVGYTEGLAWHVDTEACRHDKALAARYRAALVCPADVVQHSVYFEDQRDENRPCLGLPGERPEIDCDIWATREQKSEFWYCPEVFIFGPHHGQEHLGSTKFLDVELPGGPPNWFISVMVHPPVSQRTCPNETGETEKLTWEDGHIRTFGEGESDPYVA